MNAGDNYNRPMVDAAIVGVHSDIEFPLEASPDSSKTSKDGREKENSAICWKLR